MAAPTTDAAPHPHGVRTLLRPAITAAIAFLTLVDLFATQAVLPSLAARYAVSPAAMGTAVNASTFGMAIAGLAVALFGGRLDRRRGVALSLALLAVPTALLAVAPDLSSFAALRVVQGLCMATAFSLTLAHLGERCTADEAAGAFAAYVTGNVASNLFGRMAAAALADRAGLEATFVAFAVLNLVGAALAWRSLGGAMAVSGAVPMGPVTDTTMGPAMARVAAWRAHLATPALRVAFAIGFCILFAFIGTFTYVNFVLVGPRFGLSMMALGGVYLVFLPSLVATPLAGRAVATLGLRRAFASSLAIAGVGLPLLLLPSLPALLAGLALVAVGTFAAQAMATGFVGRVATTDKVAASGLYLACYFLGGLVGTAVLGQLFEAAGWAGCVAGIAAALAAAALLGRGLRVPPD